MSENAHDTMFRKLDEQYKVPTPLSPPSSVDNVTLEDTQTKKMAEINDENGSGEGTDDAQSHAQPAVPPMPTGVYSSQPNPYAYGSPLRFGSPVPWYAEDMANIPYDNANLGGPPKQRPRTDSMNSLSSMNSQLSDDGSSTYINPHSTEALGALSPNVVYSPGYYGYRVQGPQGHPLSTHGSLPDIYSTMGGLSLSPRGQNSPHHPMAYGVSPDQPYMVPTSPMEQSMRPVMYAMPHPSMAQSPPMGMRPYHSDAAYATYQRNSSGGDQHAHPSYRHRSHSTNRHVLQLDDDEGTVLKMALDHSQCRMLQDQIAQPNCSLKLITKVHAEVVANIATLMQDQFANYLCQRLMQVCSRVERATLGQALMDNVEEIAISVNGARALQRVFDLMPDELMEIFLTAVEPLLLSFFQHTNANHVVQCLLVRLTPEQCQFIYKTAIQHATSIALTKHGCCVLQRCIEHSEYETTDALVNAVASNLLHVVQDQYGNYVVQYILGLSRHEYTDRIITLLLPHLTLLSQQKFSSNVMEKCIKASRGDLKQSLIQAIASNMEVLLSDRYSNYVVQTALRSVTGDDFLMLTMAIKPHLKTIQLLPYGKKIANMISRGRMA